MARPPDELHEALFHACRRGKLATVRDLVNSGARPDGYRDYQGNVALGIAAVGGHTSVVEELLARFGDTVDTIRDAATDVKGPTKEDPSGFADAYRNQDGYTPLMLACCRGRRDVAQVLLRHGADCNLLDGEGATCLIHAAYRGDDALVRLLLAHGADSTVVDHDVGGIGIRGTALEIAKKEGHLTVVGILESHEAVATTTTTTTTTTTKQRQAGHGKQVGRAKL